MDSGRPVIGSTRFSVMCAIKLSPDELLLKVDELEALIRLPPAGADLEKVDALAMNIARSAPPGQIVKLAMQIMDATVLLRDAGAQGCRRAALQGLVSQLRMALQGLQKNP